MAQPAQNYNGITLKSLLENPSLLLPPPSHQEDKEKDEKDGDWWYSNETADMAAAFLGPTLWDKTLSYDSDLKLEYMDIDEFLKENGIQFNDSQQNKDDSLAPASPSSSIGASISPADLYDKTSNDAAPVGDQSPAESPMNLSMLNGERITTSPTPSAALPVTGLSPPREPSPVNVDVPFPVNESDIALATAPGQDQYDPRKRSFTEEELKPQPMVKKSRKVYVPEDLKDDKYWERRRKNNIAAKRSRDARRIKENQIVIRAAYLEKENGALKEQVLDLKRENSGLKKLVASYEKQLNELKSM